MAAKQERPPPNNGHWIGWLLGKAHEAGRAWIRITVGITPEQAEEIAVEFTEAARLLNLAAERMRRRKH